MKNKTSYIKTVNIQINYLSLDILKLVNLNKILPLKYEGKKL